MATQINSFYHQHAMEYATISDDSLTVTLPSEKEANVTYQVRCEHTANGIEAVSCQCRGFQRWGHCKHQDIVQEWQTAHYIAPKITEIEKGRWYIINSNTQIWLNEDDKWEVAGPTTRAIEIVEAHLAVREAEPAHYVMSEAVWAKLSSIQDTPKVVKVAQKFDIPVSEVEKIAAIAVEHNQAMKPKHTPMCKPIGPRDTKKDWAKEPLNGNRGFQLMR